MEDCFSSQTPITVQVPATSANLGPGFDSFGMALSLVNRFRVVRSPEDRQQWSPDSAFGESGLDLSPQNSLFFRAFQAWYDAQGRQRPAFTLTIEAHIPLARGLGSSSSVIVGGLMAAAASLGEISPGMPLSLTVQQRVMDLANRLEGHPDNVIPALLGGVGFCDEGGEADCSQVNYYPLSWPQNWQVMLVIPDKPLLTETARQVLPPHVAYPDAITNLRKASLLVWALMKQDPQAMADALEDKLHQPYRSGLIPLFAPLCVAARTAGAMGTVISGAGPSVAVFYEAQHQPALVKVLNACLADYADYPATLKPLQVSSQGALILPYGFAPPPVT